ncbi:MAG: RteC domain-containing protein [Chitinophagaceae bacterium]|nr:RteC domain-containing protein [Chitinophagaceae bacterium]
MSDLFRNLYEKLEIGIVEIEKNNPDPRKQIEACFHLCENIRRLVDKTIGEKDFQNDEEEIRFFRTIKPRFTSLVEFYSILYRAELFIPDARPDQIEFWNYELQRAQLFLTRHASLLEYLRSDDTYDDKKFFLRSSPEKISAVQDEQIAKLLAREKYVDYIITKILPALT